MNKQFGWLKKRWAFVLWMVIFSCVIIFGLWGDSIFTWLGHKRLHFWHYWEVGALASTCIFNVLFYILGFFLPPQMFRQLKPFAYVGLIPFLLIIAVLCLIGATIISLMEWDCWLQLLLLLIVAGCFLTLDGVMARRSDSERIRQDFRASVTLNDTPAFMAFLVLFIFSFTEGKTKLGAIGSNVYDPAFRAFIGGAIAFQMMVSNWVLALIFRKPGEWYQSDMK